MDALEHYKQAERLLASNHPNSYDPATLSRTGQATAHLLASIAATLATKQEGGSSATYPGDRPAGWSQYLYTDGE